MERSGIKGRENRDRKGDKYTDKRTEERRHGMRKLYIKKKKRRDWRRMEK